MGITNPVGERKAADWSNDDEDVKRERKAYWLTGMATGPDTTMGVLWGTAASGVAKTGHRMRVERGPCVTKSSRGAAGPLVS